MLPQEVRDFLVYWYPVVALLTAGILCCVHWRLSRRMPVLLAGFVLLGLFLGAVRLAWIQIGQGKLVLVDRELFDTVLTIVGFTSWSLIVLGLYLVLSDVSRRLDQALPTQEVS
jgi:hypothetical protein